MSYHNSLPVPTPSATYELDPANLDVELDRDVELSIHSSTSLRAEAPIQFHWPVTCHDKESMATPNATPKSHLNYSSSQLTSPEPTSPTLQKTDMILEYDTPTEDSFHTDLSSLSPPVSTEQPQLTNSISPNSVTCRLPTSQGMCGTVLFSLQDIREHIRDKDSPHLGTSTSKQTDVRLDCPWPGCDSNVTQRTLEGHILSHMVCFLCPLADCKKTKSGGFYNYRDSLRLHLIEAHQFEKPVAYVDRFGVLRADHARSYPM